jgi:glycosyltransferase involved in cell wall biosynthesis
MKLGIVYHMPFWHASDGTLREREGSFARYVDSLAPSFDEISLCVPLWQTPETPENPPAPSHGGTAIRSANVTLAPLPAFDGPAQFYPKLPAMLPRLMSWVRGLDVLHCRVPSPAAPFAFAFARMAGKPAFNLIVGDLRALLPTLPYRGVKKAIWRAYTEFEEGAIQWMANRALTFANGGALASKHSRPNRPVHQTTTTTIRATDIAARADTCTRRPVRLLTVSRIDPRKGLRVLPGVVSHLMALGIDSTLDIVGPVVGRPGEGERAAILEAAAERQVDTRIVIRGAVPLDELLPAYREYDLFVLPTLPGEGIPRVLLEAMASGLPVVTTGVSGIPSLITHEVNGLLAEDAAAATIADALARLVLDAPLRQRLIARGYETARGLTLETQAARMMSVVTRELGVSLRSVRLPVTPA